MSKCLRSKTISCDSSHVKIIGHWQLSAGGILYQFGNAKYRIFTMFTEQHSQNTFFATQSTCYDSVKLLIYNIVIKKRIWYISYLKYIYYNVFQTHLYPPPPPPPPPPITSNPGSAPAIILQAISYTANQNSYGNIINFIENYWHITCKGSLSNYLLFTRICVYSLCRLSDTGIIMTSQRRCHARCSQNHDFL